ncbi:MAG: DUF2341 domain-containing protein [Lentisphaerae bacterium]|nr:DUF2341 domain-containing protein [Lentisphaerota bacterium]
MAFKLKLTLITACIFSAISASAAEFYLSWQKQMQISFSGYNPPDMSAETLYDIPVLVILTNTTDGAGFSYNEFLSPPYNDLRFVAEDIETLLDFEIESWNVNGASHIWVKIPELTPDTSIYAMWGKEDVELPPCVTNGAVWNEKFAGVWHLNDTNTGDAYGDLIFTDATIRRIYGRDYVSTTEKVGLVGGGLSLNGTSDYVLIENPLPMSQWTISFWFHPLKAQGNQALFSFGNTPADGSPNLYLRLVGSSLQVYVVGGYTTLCPFSTDEWHLCTVTRNEQDFRVYFDGENVLSASKSSTGNRTYLYVGAGYNGFFDGYMDEVQALSTNLSPQEVWVSYASVIANGSFCTYGEPERLSIPIAINEFGASSVAYDSAIISGRLVSAGEFDTTVYVCWGETDGGTDLNAWGNKHTWDAPQEPGSFSLQLTDLSPDTFYYYRFAAENDAAFMWADDSLVFATGDVWLEHLADASGITFTSGSFAIHRSAAITDRDLAIRLEYSGTAEPDIDYVALSETIVIPANETSIVIEINPLLSQRFGRTKIADIKPVSGAVFADNGSVVVKIVAENLSLWAKHMPITFSGYAPPGGSAGLTNFPALIKLRETNDGAGFFYSDFLSPEYDDLRFMESDQITPLDFEVQTWDPGGTSLVWVKIPNLTAETTIYALWGRADALFLPCRTNGVVWQESFTGVWHLEETEGTAIYDSKQTLPSAKVMGTKVTLGVTGKIGNAFRFAGNTGYIQTGVTNETTLTVSTWATCDSTDAMLWAKVRYNPDLWFYGDKLYLNTGDSQSNPFGLQPANVDQWHHYVTVLDSSKARAYLYIDGYLASDTASYKNPAGAPFCISSGSGYDWVGLIDEFSTANIARSSDWIWSTWKNQGENGQFNTYGVPNSNLSKGMIMTIR